jgi:hypothetical protein
MQLSFGGVDDPEHRNGHWPAEFKPNENPFYVALPFGEFESESGNELRADALSVPWYRAGLSPLLKNHWVVINRGDRTCYAQWEDVGPFEVDDFAFVFGSAKRPRNTFDAKAGLDVSPACWQYLRMDDNAETAWRFVDAADVPRALDRNCHHIGKQSPQWSSPSGNSMSRSTPAWSRACRSWS